jgi:hypothetical protein
MLSSAVIMQRLMLIFWEYTGGEEGIQDITPLIANPLHYYWFVLAVLGGITLLLSWMARSRWGLILRAIRGDEATCLAAGLPITAVPIFTDRFFQHQYIYTRRDSGINGLADLRGRRLVRVDGAAAAASDGDRLGSYAVALTVGDVDLPEALHLPDLRVGATVAFGAQAAATVVETAAGDRLTIGAGTFVAVGAATAVPAGAGGEASK